MGNSLMRGRSLKYSIKNGKVDYLEKSDKSKTQNPRHKRNRPKGFAKVFRVPFMSEEKK